MPSHDNSTPFSATDYEREILATVPHYALLHQEVIDLVQAVHPEPKLWLDTGCGDGALVGKACAVFPATRFLLADPAPAMLAQARQRLTMQPAGGCHFMDGIDTANLPRNLAQAPEVISAVLAHHYLDARQRETATRHCFDLLVDGGIYITFENIRPASATGEKICLERWQRFQIAHGKSAASASEHATRFGRSYFPITTEAHLELLLACGFRSVELFWLSGLQAGFYAIK